MARIFRWLLRIVTGGLLLAFLIGCVTYYLASRSIPDYNARLTVEGLSGPVEIVRDNANVPHIFGSSDEDVYFGLGFAHAQDRLWQITMARRAAQGRLSELFGVRTAKTDELLRRFGLYEAASASVSSLDAETRAALEAYSAGINAWIATVNEGALGRGAPEFFLFSREIAPWRPADTVALGKIMALQLTGQLSEEVLRARVSLQLPEERLADILPDVPGPGAAALPDYASLMPIDGPQAAWKTYALDRMSPIKPRIFAGASNAWAAAPKRSAAGASILANDPHLELTAPTVWYLARIELSTGGVIGGTIPGIPFVLSGRSDALAWGITSAYLDDQDVFMEELNPANPQEYRTPTGWKPFSTKSSIIRIKDAEPITITLRRTENGPVLPGSHYNLASVTPAGHVGALGWTALSPRDTSMQAALGLQKAHSIEEAIAAMELYIAPAQNLTLAEPGRVALKMVGAMPSRNPAHDSQGRMPALGWKATNRWAGRIPYDRNPEFIDPEGGILGNTNNKTVDRPFPEHVSFNWGDTQRIQRWTRLMQTREVHTRESFIDAQLDTVSVTARTLLPLIARDLWFTGEAAPEGTPERQRQKALELLANWNGEMSEHLPEPLIFAAWLRHLQGRLIRDELGPLSAEFVHPEPLFLERVFRDVDGAAVWCDVVQSTAQESCTDIARIALDEALLWIAERYGTQLESLRWGDAHEALHDHAVLGDVPVLKWIVNIHQSTSGGDFTLLRGRTKGTEPDPYANVHGAGFRGVYDFSDPDSSVFITATGQSGHPLSRHYDDLGALWRRGEYIPMSLDPELARAANVGVTVLTPAQ
ncbi:penicillin acylase family protein [Oceanicola sp. 502str15]|uniref:penicillin acylase family protein n=1 Tax=Oceanicola sp. 502str15 TaxID=2696061 RepID=UPI0020948D9F|nr:penicillin acylase family protein [Oceanicola sp. 502str15]MCO6382138.1 penicillin acylase family protein [Oceanicola sp. 502str15]